VICEAVIHLGLFGLHDVCGPCVLIPVFRCHGCAVRKLVDVLRAL